MANIFFSKLLLFLFFQVFGKNNFFHASACFSLMHYRSRWQHEDNKSFVSPKLSVFWGHSKILWNIFSYFIFLSWVFILFWFIKYFLIHLPFMQSSRDVTNPFVFGQFECRGTKADQPFLVQFSSARPGSWVWLIKHFSSVIFRPVILNRGARFPRGHQ